MVHFPQHLNFSVPITKNAPNPPPDLSIRQTPTAGLGLFSTDFILAGTLIYSEPPLLQIDHSSSTPFDSLIARSLSTTDPLTALEFYALHNSHHHRSSSSSSPSTEAGIWLTNCIALSPSTSGTFLLTSRVNHSCIPNVEVEWCAERQMIGAFARRDVKAGEELVRTYFEHPVGHRLVEARRKYLAAGWAFECACLRCVNEAGYWRDKEVRERERKVAAAGAETETAAATVRGGKGVRGCLIRG
jgi:hypothetical protein